MKYFQTPEEQASALALAKQLAAAASAKEPWNDKESTRSLDYPEGVDPKIVKAAGKILVAALRKMDSEPSKTRFDIIYPPNTEFHHNHGIENPEPIGNPTPVAIALESTLTTISEDALLAAIDAVQAEQARVRT